MIRNLSIVWIYKMALEWAMNIKTAVDLDEALDINEVNIRGLLEEIKELKKEMRKMERDYDVLYFDYQMLKNDDSEPDARKGKCMAIE